MIINLKVHAYNSGLLMMFYFDDLACTTQPLPIALGQSTLQLSQSGTDKVNCTSRSFRGAVTWLSGQPRVRSESCTRSKDIRSGNVSGPHRGLHLIGFLARAGVPAFASDGCQLPGVPAFELADCARPEPRHLSSLMVWSSVRRIYLIIR